MNLRQIWMGLLSANGFTLDIAIKNRRNLVDYLRDLKRVYLSYSCEPPLQRVELSELAPKDLDTIFVPLQYIRRGATPFNDLVALAVLTRMKRPECVFEIGTFEGLSAVIFAGNSAAKVFTLDLPQTGNDIGRSERSYQSQSIRESYISGFLIDQLGFSNRVTRLFGDSAVFDFTPFYQTVDIFFVDGAHTTDYVINDSMAAFKCIKADGIVIWHDCLNSSVLTVLRRYAAKVPVYYIVGTSLAFARGKSGTL